MTLGVLPYIGVLLFLRLPLTRAASFGEVCFSNSDCTDANTICDKFLNCTAGTCKCSSGYGNSNDSGCGKLLRSYGQTCDSSSYCSGVNQECGSAGTCTCSTWYTYNSLEQGCVTSTYNVLTETCGGWWQLQCLVQDTAGGECNSASTCQCKSGYTFDSSESYTTCRAPRYGESCLSEPECTISYDTTTVSDDLSSDTPTCHQSTCQCPPSHDHVVVMGYDLCLVTPETGTVLKSTGADCTDFNECESSLCVKCVNTTQGVCMENEDEEIGDNSSVMTKARVMVMLTAFVFVLFNKAYH